jgi:hypothetical protein
MKINFLFFASFLTTLAKLLGVLRKYSPTAPLRWFDDVS